MELPIVVLSTGRLVDVTLTSVLIVSCYGNRSMTSLVTAYTVCTATPIFNSFKTEILLTETSDFLIQILIRKS